MDEEESVIKLELLKISEVCKDGLIYHDFQISSKSPLPLKHETPAPDNLEKVVDEPLKFGVREDDDKTGVEGLTRMLNDVSRKEQLNPKMEILYADPHRVKLRVHLLQGKNYRVICRMNDDNVKNSPIHVSTAVKKKSILMERLDALSSEASQIQIITETFSEGWNHFSFEVSRYLCVGCCSLNSKSST